jgi:predicted ATP-grasp superfamily ATP-dependent carboligase
MIVPNIEADPDLLRHVLQRFAHQFFEQGVLFPTTDTAVLTLARIQEDLENYVTVTPPRAIVETCVLKTKFYKSLQAAGIPHPMTLYPKEVPIDVIMQQIAFPMYIRPAQSLIFSQRFRRKGFVAHNPQELKKFVALATREGLEVMVQEVIPGPATNGYIIQGYFNQRSRPIVIVPAQKIRQPTMFSNESIEVVIPRIHAEECIQHLLDYFHQIQYCGLFGAEFKRDARDGSFKLLEVNARSMGGNAISAACGANDILTAYRDVLGEKVAPLLTYESGLYFIDVGTDLETMLALVVRRDFSIREFLHPYRQKKAFNILSRTDPLPFLTLMSTLLHKLPSGLISIRSRSS